MRKRIVEIWMIFIITFLHHYSKLRENMRRPTVI